MIDPDLKLRLAKAARDLAAELEAGTGPKLGTGMQFHPNGEPCCAMGHVYARAGLTPVRPAWADTLHVGPAQLPIEAITVSYPVENANDSLAPWLESFKKDRIPLPVALREYALAVEGL